MFLATVTLVTVIELCYNNDMKKGLESAMKKSNKYMKNKKKIITKEGVFFALYLAEFIGGALIGLFSKSFFAYQAFNSLWASILYLCFAASLFITAFVHEVLDSRATGDVITNVAVFIVGLVMFLLLYIFGGVFILCALAYSAILAVVVGCRYILLLRKDEDEKFDARQFLAIANLLLFAMVDQLRVKYVNNDIFKVALIPAAVIFAVAITFGVVVLRKVWGKMYPEKWGSFGNAVCVVLIVFLGVYFYSYTAIGVANCTFDKEPTQKECVVLEKHVLSGARTVTQFELKISIDGKHIWINVPVTEYHQIDKGDTITVDYYKGAFNLPYYKYSSAN